MDTGTPQMLPRDPVESMPNTQYKEIKQTRYRVHGKSVVYVAVRDPRQVVGLIPHSVSLLPIRGMHGKVL